MKQLGLIALVACGHHVAKQPAVKKDAAAAPVAPSDGDVTVLPPAPPLPAPPAALPAIKVEVTPEAVAFGEYLFRDQRLASDGKTACATCHDPAHGFAGAGHPKTAGGEPNLRRPSAIVDLFWKKQLGWDGRYDSLHDQLPAHIKGQLGRELAVAMTELAKDPIVHAYQERAAVEPEAALTAYVSTRYSGDTPWDAAERGKHPPADLKTGYELFLGRARCAQCHPPPLYQDNGFHHVVRSTTDDKGRGLVEPTRAGEFATPTLRGAALRPAFFHDGSAATLDAAIDWHLAGGTGQGADPSIVDPALKKIALTKTERDQLGAFVRALTEAK